MTENPRILCSRAAAIALAATLFLRSDAVASLTRYEGSHRPAAFSFQNCFGQTDPTCLAVPDFDTSDVSDGDIDLDDYARFFECFRGPFVTPDQTCGIPQRAGVPPPSGTFTLHGRPVDILSDGHTLLDFRARSYDPALGRWLQRDPLAYNDGFNLYEPFGNNPLANLDPTGEGIITWLLVGDYSLSDAQFLRDNGFRTVTTPIYGFFEGGAQTVAGGAKEFGLIFVGESAAQQRLVNLVEAEFEVGGATTGETGIVILRATGQGIVDFFGASNVATAVTGEQIISVEEGQVFVVDVGGFERVQAGVGGVGQFAAGVGGLGGAGLSRLAQPATSAVRMRVLANIAESQAARAASRFEVFATHEATLPALTARGGTLPIRIGRAGQVVSAQATGLPKNTTRIPSASGRRFYRVPDHMELVSQRYIAETKNVNYQYLSSQILDDAAYVTRGSVPGRVEVIIDTRTDISLRLLREHLNPGSPIKVIVQPLSGGGG